MTDFILGAVAYDAKVVPIWEGFKRYFEARGLPFDFVLFSNYERQVAAHLRGELDVAWNSPLAWIHTKRAAPERISLSSMMPPEITVDLTALNPGSFANEGPPATNTNSTRRR